MGSKNKRCMRCNKTASDHRYLLKSIILRRDTHHWRLQRTKWSRTSFSSALFSLFQEVHHRERCQRICPMGPQQSVELLQIVADMGRSMMRCLSVGGVWACNVHTHMSAYSISKPSDRNREHMEWGGVGVSWWKRDHERPPTQLYLHDNVTTNSINHKSSLNLH